MNMTKLLLTTEDAPTKSIMAVLSTWQALAELIEAKVALPKNCRLVWHLHFQHVGFRGHPLSGFVGNVKPEDKVDCWEAFTTASIVRSVPAHCVSVTSRVGDGNDDVDLPVIQVNEIMLNDNGTFYWHCNMQAPTEESEDVKLLAKALNGETVTNGHRYWTGMHQIFSGIEAKE